MPDVPQKMFDVLIIGSGAAGLSLALRLPGHIQCAVLAKRELKEGNTLYAQGGISAVLDPKDSLSSHVADTLKAGAGLCKKNVVQTVVERGPDNIRWLTDTGVAFTQTPPTGDSAFHLTREGGHSHRRVVHAADATGKEVETNLVSAIKQRPNTQLIEHAIAIDLITRNDGKRNNKRCIGAYMLNLQSKKISAISAKCVVLATGGQARFICIPATLMLLLVMALQWLGAQVAVSPIWNSSSFIPHAYTTHKPNLF